ncbi:MAG TPA: HAMP domain-containing protein, partial [Candidatus Methylomirabilis sp.]|nr:HAMP domain-containing protein [Candidatus Methylomirabilis sp.]
MRRLHFRDSLTARIAGLFVLFLVAATAAGVIAIREFARRDLEHGTRGEVLRAQGRMESVLVRIRQEASLFAELGARAEEAEERSQVRGASVVRITLAEQSREKGIHLETLRAGEVPGRMAAVFQRGFAGMPTADYVLLGDVPARVLLVAVAPAGGTERDRKVVAASVTLGREFLRRESRAIGGEVMFFRGGQVVASSSTCLECEECIRKTLSDPAQARELDLGRPIYFTFDCRPEPQAAVAVPLRTFDGKTVVMALSQSTEGERKALFHATIGLVVGAIGFTAVLGAVFLLLVFRVVRPLRALTQAATSIAEGKYGGMVPVQGGDEVAGLGAAFNRMSVSMEQAMREISEWNRLLETRVVEKTRELEQVHLRMVEVERLAAMGQVAAGVAHELNNPLSGIMGYSDLALEKFRGRPPEKVTPGEIGKMIGYFEHVGVLVRRCRNIILDMLKFARQPTEEFSLQDLNTLIGETLSFLGHQLLQGRIDVVRECPEGLPPFRGNALQMQQVFTNLLVNAVHAMPGGGVVT